MRALRTNSESSPEATRISDPRASVPEPRDSGGRKIGRNDLPLSLLIFARMALKLERVKGFINIEKGKVGSGVKLNLKCSIRISIDELIL